MSEDWITADSSDITDTSDITSDAAAAAADD